MSSLVEKKVISIFSATKIEKKLCCCVFAPKCLKYFFSYKSNEEIMPLYLYPKNEQVCQKLQSY